MNPLTDDAVPDHPSTSPGLPVEPDTCGVCGDNPADRRHDNGAPQPGHPRRTARQCHQPRRLYSSPVLRCGHPPRLHPGAHTRSALAMHGPSCPTGPIPIATGGAQTHSPCRPQGSPNAPTSLSRAQPSMPRTCRPTLTRSRSAIAGPLAVGVTRSHSQGRYATETNNRDFGPQSSVSSAPTRPGTLDQTFGPTTTFDPASNVTTWRDGAMVLRWCAAGRTEAPTQFR